jgi:hypothetical protein
MDRTCSMQRDGDKCMLHFSWKTQSKQTLGGSEEENIKIDFK